MTVNCVSFDTNQKDLPVYNMYLYILVSICLNQLPIRLPIYLFIYLTIYLSFQAVCSAICRSILLSAQISVCLYI